MKEDAKKKIMKNEQKKANLNFTWILTLAAIACVLIIFSTIIVRPAKNPPIQSAGPDDSGNAPEATAEREAPVVESGKRSLGIFIEIPDEVLDEIEPTSASVPERLAYLDPEYFENQTETNGIIYGGTVIALLIFLSTLALLILERIRDSESHEK